jgi:tetratricopeptide (TPR) repeat protein
MMPTVRKLRWAGVVLPLFLLLLVAANRPEKASQPADGKATTRFVGSRSCRECHERFYKLWEPSHHGKAMQPFTQEFAASELLPQTNDIAIGPLLFRADFSGTNAWVYEVGPQGTNRYAMLHAMGGKNVYYFLTPLEKGRLQVLPIAYHVVHKEWYDTTASMVRHFHGIEDAPLDWRDPMLTFNTACFNCHVSQLTKNYDPETDTYHTEWVEPGINCETCHGPADEHNRVCREAPAGTVPKDLKIIRTGPLTPLQRDAICAPCHAKMSPLTSTFQPGDRYFDHYDLVTLEDGDFHPDGRDLGENYTYTSWLMSPCLKGGKFECNHCHTSSGRYRFAGTNTNHACLPCHAERVADAPAHTRHKQGSKGNQCVSCHMPMTIFAHMRRSDHSLRPPTPSATLSFKSPNACNICHTKKDAAWADKHVRKWHKDDYQAPVLKRAALLDAARKGDWSKLDPILDYIQQPDADVIFTTAFLRLLDTCNDKRVWPVLRKLAAHPSPLARSSAVQALQDDTDSQSLRVMLDATRDDVRIVRVKAAIALSRHAGQELSEADRQSLDAATAEYLHSLTSRPDDWSSHYNLGNYFVDRQQPRKALESFKRSSRFRPDVILPLVNRSMVHARLGENTEAEDCLRRAIAIEPENSAVNFNLALLVAEKQRGEEAESLLRKALKSDPRFAAAAYNLGVLLSRRRPAEGINWCRKAVAFEPQEPKYGYSLGFFLAQNGKTAEAETELRKLMARSPAFADAGFFLGNLYEQQQRPDDARQLYRRMITNRELPRAARRQAESRLRAIGTRQ